MMIKKYPVACYYFVTLLISWGGLVLLVGGADKISAHSGSNVSFALMYFMTVVGPSTAGLLLTGFYGGRKGYREFLSRLFKWRVPIIWYVIAFLVAPLTVFGTLFILYSFSPAFLPGIFQPGNSSIVSMFGLPGGNKISLILFVAMLGLFNGLAEEIGWTGFVTSRMQTLRVLTTHGLILGFMWGLWHLLSNYIGSAKDAGVLPLPIYMTIILFSFLPPFRIIMTWVYSHTGSLLIAILMHASLDVFWILATPISLTGKQRVIWYLAWAIVLWLLVIMISITSKKSRLPQ